MKFHRKIRLDRIASSTRPARVGGIVEVSPTIALREGAIIVGRALNDNRTYGDVELPNGRLARVVRGNLIAGVLGARRALHGYMGDVPSALEVGDEVHLLNLGGVLGHCDQPNLDLGPPIRLEVLGQVSRDGALLNIADFSLPPCAALRPDGPPVAMVFGTCMNSGKTFAAAEVIRILSHAGIRVAAGKVSGVAARRDLLKMEDNGAVAIASFADCGLPSTVNATDLAGVARAVVQELERSTPDLILLELGDGILGGYHTESILADASLRERTRSRILCASDLVGAWGSKQMLAPIGHAPQVISGPVTDNAVGTSYIERELGIACANARYAPDLLARVVAENTGLTLGDIP